MLRHVPDSAIKTNNSRFSVWRLASSSVFSRWYIQDRMRASYILSRDHISFFRQTAVRSCDSTIEFLPFIFSTNSFSSLIFQQLFKFIYPKYSKHWPYTLAHTIDCVCSKMLDHGLFLSLFKLIPCPMHWISYLNFKAVLALTKTAGSAQTHKSISFIWIVWSTLYVYLWIKGRKFRN